MTKDEALKLALEALETVRHKIDCYQVNVCDDVDEAITAIQEALAQPEQGPKKIPESWATHGGLWIESLYKHQRGEK